MITAKLMAPKLPKGYRFNVSTDVDGDLRIRLQRREWWLWPIPYWSTVKARWILRSDKVDSITAMVESSMVDMAGKLIIDVEMDNSFSAAVSPMLGNYPPKKHLMED